MIQSSEANHYNIGFNFFFLVWLSDIIFNLISMSQLYVQERL